MRQLAAALGARISSKCVFPIRGDDEEVVSVAKGLPLLPGDLRKHKALKMRFGGPFLGRSLLEMLRPVWYDGTIFMKL